MMSVRSEKKLLRREMGKLLSDTEDEIFVTAGKLLAARLFSLPVWDSAACVCAFLSMGKEIDTDIIVKTASVSGKILCLPRVEGDDLSFRVSAWNDTWATGPFGIREPVPDAPSVDFSIVPGPILVIVPGLAFDSELRRLGRGKGFYDRFLESIRSVRNDITAVGVGLEMQIVESVPVDQFDQYLDAVICV